jgi:cytochrome P450
MHSRFGDRPLTDAEILDMLTVLVLAGLDTTRAQLGYLFRHLAANPEDRAALIADPGLIPSAVEEALRFYTIIFGDGRKVTRDIGRPVSPAPIGLSPSTVCSQIEV